MKKLGIYEIRNTVSDRVYVGCSTDLDQRLRTHKKKLKAGVHSSTRLQASWNKHGESAFVFTIIEFVEAKEDLVAREQHWIDTLGATSQNHGFNVRLLAHCNHGNRHTPEAIEKIRTAGTGRRHTPEALARMSAIRKGLKGKPHTAESKAKMSAAIKMAAGTPEARERTRATHQGRKRSAETIARLSASNTGKVCSEETKAKLRAANLGKKHSEESRIKQSIAGKGRKRTPEQIARTIETWTGRKHSEESRARMSESARNRKKRVTPSTTPDQQELFSASASRPHAPQAPANLLKGSEKRLPHANPLSATDAY